MKFQKHFGWVMVAVFAFGGGAACGLDVEDDFDAGWSEFLAAHTYQQGGESIYVVEWDMRMSLEQLRDYYESQFDSSSRSGRRQQASIVRTLDGRDDIWPTAMARNLSFCVSDRFEADKARVMFAARTAAANWSAVSPGIRFVVHGSCGSVLAPPVFQIVPWERLPRENRDDPPLSYSPTSFFPSDYGTRELKLRLDVPTVDLNDWNMVSVFRHELGHVLGLRHEHIRPESGNAIARCTEPDNWRPLTSYDRNSIMHYDWCAGTPASMTVITDFDKEGIRSLYGAYFEPWYIAVL